MILWVILVYVFFDCLRNNLDCLLAVVGQQKITLIEPILQNCLIVSSSVIIEVQIKKKERLIW